MKLAEIADGILAHLKRFERDPKINAPIPKYNTRPYYNANVWQAGSRVGIRYVSYQNDWFLRKAFAEQYLAWLNAGHVGPHYLMEREQESHESQ